MSVFRPLRNNEEQLYFFAPATKDIDAQKPDKIDGYAAQVFNLHRFSFLPVHDEQDSSAICKMKMSQHLQKGSN